MYVIIFMHILSFTCRNIIKFAKDHSNAEEIVLSAVQEIFVGNSFYLGMKVTVCSSGKCVTLLDILKYCDHDIPTYAQEQENPGTSLIANQIIPVVGKSNTDVSSVIRAVLKCKDSNIENCSRKKSTQKYYSLLPKKFSQEEPLESSLFSQPTICLSCDSTDHPSCDDSKFISGGSNFCHSKSGQGPHHSVIDTILPKSTSNCESVQLSKKKTGLNLTYDDFKQEVGSSDSIPSHSSKKENFHDSRGSIENREECDTCVCLDSIVNTSYDLFDSPHPLKQEPPDSPCAYPCKKYSKINTDNLEPLFPLKVNNFQRNVKRCPKYGVQSCSEFSQDISTPSPVHKMTCTSAYKHRGSYNMKNLSSSKYSSRKRPSSISPRLEGEEVASDVLTESVREVESPLLFSDTSCDVSVTSPNSDWEDNSTSLLSPDVFTSTPGQSSTQKKILPPYLVKRIFKD